MSGSEARWERLTHDVTEGDVNGLLRKVGNKTRFAFAREACAKPKTRKAAGTPRPPTVAADSVVDLALGVAACGKSVSGIAELLTEATASEDEMLWAAMAQLAADFPDSDPDGDVWTWATRHRSTIESGAEQAAATRAQRRRERESRAVQIACDLD